MRIGLSSSVAATSCASSDGSLSVGEFLARFPEVPGDLAGEPILADYVAAFLKFIDWAEADRRLTALSKA